MPLYDYRCQCGLFEAVAGYEDYTIACPSCNGTAERVPVYREQGVIFKGAGFTKSVLPPRPNTQAEHDEVNELMKGEMTKRNYPTERAYDEMRQHKFHDETGALRVDTRKMTQEI